jgi:hypothetical protein
MTTHFACLTRHAVIASACLLLCLLAPPSYAAGIAELHVSENQGIYSINLVMQMQVPARYVHRVLTDYVHIYRLDPAITDSEILTSPEAGVVRVRTRITDCIGFYCMKIDRVDDVRELGHDTLQVTTIPTLGSFKSGHAEWKILGMEERTQVIYQAQMELDFYIPPLIGIYFVTQKLRKSIIASLEKIECIARIQAAQERNHALDPLLVADEAADEHAVDAALLAGQDTTLVARAPAAGNTVREQTDCVQPCGINDATCYP